MTMRKTLIAIMIVTLVLAGATYAVYMGSIPYLMALDGNSAENSAEPVLLFRNWDTHRTIGRIQSESVLPASR